MKFQQTRSKVSEKFTFQCLLVFKFFQSLRNFNHTVNKLFTNFSDDFRKIVKLLNTFSDDFHKINLYE